MARTVKQEKAPGRTKAIESAEASRDASVRSEAGLQARLLETQAAMDRDHGRLRELEAFYRHLFTAGTEPLLVVDAETLRVIDANPAACTVLGSSAQKLIGSPASTSFETKAAVLLQAMAAEMMRGGEPRRFRVEAAAGGKRLTVSASLFRRDRAFVLLLRLDADDARIARAQDAGDAWALYSAASPDGIVLTDLAGKVLQANATFVEMVQLATERQIRGESLGRWLGRTSVDLGVLVTNLRQRGTLKLFATHLRAEYGSLTDVEISAARVSVDGQGHLGFTIRDVGRRLMGDSQARSDLSKSVGQLTELVGRVPMREIVANTSSLIEKMSIEAALQLTRDNRAAAAELLGLSRQSLYVKLRRYGLGDISSDEEAES